MPGAGAALQDGSRHAVLHRTSRPGLQRSSNPSENLGMFSMPAGLHVHILRCRQRSWSALFACCRFGKDLVDRYELQEQIGRGACSAADCLSQHGVCLMPCMRHLLYDHGGLQGPLGWCMLQQTDKVVKGAAGTMWLASYGICVCVHERFLAHRVAVKTMTKRYGPDGLLEANFVRRVQHEVSSYAHPTSSHLISAWHKPNRCLTL
jgi:hypothetical protein